MKAMNNAISKIIEQWIIATWKNQSYKKYNDLHIDTVNPVFTDQKNWVAGGLLCLNIAADVRDKRKIPGMIMLGFSLRSGKKPYGINFSNFSEFQKELDWSPPSLYLMMKMPQKIKKVRLPFLPNYVNAYYSEYLTEWDEDYRRSLLIFRLKS